MARDTDRKIISEALRVTEGAEHWDRHYLVGSNIHGGSELTLTHDETGDELNITYSRAGRIVALHHWQVVGPRFTATRTPIHTNKRQYVLNVLGAK